MIWHVQQNLVKCLMIPLPRFSYIYWLIHFKLNRLFLNIQWRFDLFDQYCFWDFSFERVVLKPITNYLKTVSVKVLAAFFRAIFENVRFLVSTIMINYSLGNSAPAFSDIIFWTIISWKSCLLNDIMFVFKLCLVLNLKTCAELFTCKANICFNCAG